MQSVHRSAINRVPYAYQKYLMYKSIAVSQQTKFISRNTNNKYETRCQKSNYLCRREEVFTLVRRSQRAVSFFDSSFVSLGNGSKCTGAVRGFVLITSENMCPVTKRPADRQSCSDLF